MSELAIILTGFHAGPSDPPRGAPVPLPALSRLARFGHRQDVVDWRVWLAGWLRRPDLAGVPPAVIAASQLPAPQWRVAGVPAGSVWLAVPVHLQAGLRSVHMPPHGLLQLDDTERAVLVHDFDAGFAARGFRLQPVAGGLLVFGPAFEAWPVTTDPALLPGADIAGHTPRGKGAAALLGLGAELEMWFHAHPLNAARLRARRPAITTLWLWGGGAAPRSLVADSVIATTTGAVLGGDAFIAGLCALAGAAFRPDRADAATILEACGRHARVAVVLDLFTDVLPAGPAAIAPAAAPPVHELLQRLDRELLGPLQAGLGRGIGRLHFLANGHATTLAARDGLRFWRRPRGALAVLH